MSETATCTSAAKNERTVKRVLADGTIKEYRYAAHRSRSLALVDEQKSTGKHLYFMQVVDGGRFKIGRSVSPKRRLRDLQLASGVRIKLRAVLKNKGELEQAIHARLKQFRLIGEWFQWTEESRAIIVDIFGPLDALPEPPEPIDSMIKRAVERIHREHDGRKAAAAERKLAYETMCTAKRAHAHETKGLTFNQWLAWQSGDDLVVPPVAQPLHNCTQPPEQETVTKSAI